MAVVGEATSPTGIPYRMHMTLLDLMIAVGGMTEYADGNASLDLLYVSHEISQIESNVSLTSILLKDPLYPFT